MDPQHPELSQMITRLEHLTHGSSANEHSLKRNAVGQLGFHVQQDGLVTEVEASGYAWKAGLRPGYRIVEVCK